MKTRKQYAVNTKEHLLVAAGAVFAKKGYREATVADICRRAGANIAAVNYHFGSKRELYIAAWRHAFLESIRAHDPDGGVPENAPAEERLRGKITALLRRITDQDNVEFLIVHKEMVNPTGLLRRMHRELMEPLRRRMEAVIREILGPAASPEQVRFSQASVLSQCFNPLVRKPGPGKHDVKSPAPLAGKSLERYADHVVRFSLGGLNEVMRGKLILILVPALLFLAGCAAVGPNYTRPAAKTSASWHTVPGPGVSGAAADPKTLAEWWRTFDDPQLSGLIARAINGNLDLKQAGAKVRQARALRGVAGAALWPTVDGSANASWNRTGATGDAQTGELYSAGFDAAWEVDVFGGTRRSVEAAQDDLEAQQENLRDTLVSLTAETAVNYLDVRTYQTKIAVAEANLRAQSETYDLARWRREAGLSDSLAEEQARYNLETTRAAIPLIRTNLEAATNRLAVLLGEQPGALHKELETVKPLPSVPAEVAVGIPAEALRRRPDVRRAERELASQTAQVGVATADLYPKLRLIGSLGLETLSLSSPGPVGSWTISGGPAITWPIFNAGSIRGKIEAQTAVQEQYVYRYETTVLTALEEVENALTAYAQEQNRRNNLREAVEAAAAASGLAEQKYSAGLTDFTSVLEAQRSLLSLQEQLAQSDGNIATDLVRLYKALGGGWTAKELK